MRYDFDSVVTRRNTDSLKWDVGERELPMWVADMDFQTAPEVVRAIQKRAEHGVFGYGVVPDEWGKAIASWWRTRHGFPMRREKLVFCTGVVPAISSIVRKFTTPNENVLVLTPVYNIFFNSIVNNGRRVLECPLSYDGGAYAIDFADLEQKLGDPQTTLMILCNPHNPVGKIWERETLKRIGDLCAKYGVLVISDEIHCDLTDPEKNYVPFASASESCAQNSITCLSASKAFNLAGLQSAAVYAENDRILHKVWRALNTDEVAEPNAFAVGATVAAFTEGGAWLDSLRAYLYENKKFAREFLQRELPKMGVTPSEATYLLWLDCGAYTADSDKLCEDIRKKTGLYLSAGGAFGGNGKSFLRLNFACPRAVLEDGLQRLKKALS